ncbi:MAG: stage V sporulation T C-terminal domain-containing protein [Clostridia bacterium]
MKATGIVRKIDDLGRVVIPKEIRKNLKIRVGDPLEIFIEENGQIILQKYAPMGDMLDIVTKYAKSLYDTSGFDVCITDKETVIAANGPNKPEYFAREISEHVLKVMNDRAIWSTNQDSPKNLTVNDDLKSYYAQVIAPIICEGEAIGVVILFSTKSDKKITDSECKLVKSAAVFLATQLEV